MSIDKVSIKDVKNNLAGMLRSVRKGQSLSREALAEQLNLSRITIQNLETGKNVTLDTLFKVLQHFGLLEEFNTFLIGQKEKHSGPSLY